MSSIYLCCFETKGLKIYIWWTSSWQLTKMIRLRKCPSEINGPVVLNHLSISWALLNLWIPLAHLLYLLWCIHINTGSTRVPQDPWSSVMALWPDPDIAGHHGDKNTQTHGRVYKPGGEAVAAPSITEDFRGEEDCNYSCLLTSAFYVVSKAFNGCPFRDNDLPERYKCKDNHTQEQCRCGGDNASPPSASLTT